MEKENLRSICEEIKLLYCPYKGNGKVDKT